MTDVTLWRIWNKDRNAFEHNHLEDGHIADPQPTVLFPTQNGWRNASWQRMYGHLIDGKVRHVGWCINFIEKGPNPRCGGFWRTDIIEDRNEFAAQLKEAGCRVVWEEE